MRVQSYGREALGPQALMVRAKVTRGGDETGDDETVIKSSKAILLLGRTPV